MSHEHEIEETIKEIAAKHGIAVGRDDPISVSYTHLTLPTTILV